MTVTVDWSTAVKTVNVLKLINFSNLYLTEFAKT